MYMCIHSFQQQKRNVQFCSKVFRLTQKFTLDSTTKTENQVESRLFLDVVVRKGASIFKLFPSKDESLLVWWDTFLVLDLSLHVLNCIGSFDLESDGLASQGFHEDLHTTTESENQMEGRLLLDVVIR